MSSLAAAATNLTGQSPGGAAVVAPGSADRAHAMAVENWKQTHADKRGYRWDKVVGPSGQIERVEVSSWLQVPEILAKLEIGRQSGNPCDVRLTFPRPSEGTDTDQAHAIVAAQKEISAFFKENHSKSSADARQALIEKVGSTTIPGGLTAEQWVDAHVTLNEKQPSALSVTELIKIEGKKSGGDKPNDLQATLESALDQPTKHKIAFVVPGPGEAGFSQEAQQLAKTLGTTKAAGSSEIGRARQEALSRVSVWVEGADARGAAGEIQPPKVFSVEEFIKEVDQRPNPEPAKVATVAPVAPAVPPVTPATSEQPSDLEVGSRPATASADVTPSPTTGVGAAERTSQAHEVPSTDKPLKKAAEGGGGRSQRLPRRSSPKQPLLDEGAVAELYYLASEVMEPLRRGDEPSPVRANNPVAAGRLANHGLVSIDFPEGPEVIANMTLTPKGKKVLENLPPNDAYAPHLNREGRRSTAKVNDQAASGTAGAESGAGAPTAGSSKPVAPAPDPSPAAVAKPAPSALPTKQTARSAKPGRMKGSLDSAGEVIRLGENAEQRGWGTPLVVENLNGATELAQNGVVSLTDGPDGKKIMTLTEKGAKYLDVWNDAAAS